MIYKFHAFELLPWGATLKIEGKSSDKQINILVRDSTISSSTWVTRKEALGKDRSFFMESKKEPVSITYGVKSKNGDLVDIQTNLTCTSTKVNGIITEFTLDNTDWFNRPFVTDKIFIEKKIQKVKITLNNTPYSTNQNYLKFYVNNNQIYYDNYIDKTFYFNVNSIVNENSNIKAIYNFIDEIEETVTSIADSSYTNYGRAYVNKGVSQVISIYNVTKQKEISNISPTYDSQKRQYFFRIRVNTSEFEIGNVLKIKYKYYEKATEDVNTVSYSGSTYSGKGYVTKSKDPINVSFYNITKGVDISSAYGFYDSTEQKYGYRFTVNSTYAIGDKIRIVYYYLNLNEIEEDQEAIEDTDSTLHEGTIPSNNTNLVIEECVDSNNYVILFTRKNSNTISLYNDMYDNQNIIVKYEKEKPYVKLYCNNVRIENCFNNTGVGFQNDFGRINPAPSNNSKYICPCAKSTGQRAYFARYCTISWDKDEENEVFYGDEKGNLKDRYGFTILTDKGYKIEGTIDEHRQYNGSSYKNITIPALKKQINGQYCNTARFGFTVNFEGEDEWQTASTMYVKGGIPIYTRDGYIKDLSINNHNIDNDFMTGIPSLTTLEKWGGNENIFYFLKEDNTNKYIYPADGIELFTDWTDLCNCLGYEPICDSDGCLEDGSSSFPWKGRAKGGYNVREEPNPNSTYIGGVGAYSPEHEQIMVNDEVTNEYGHYYYISFRYSEGGDWHYANGYVLADGIEKYDWDEYICSTDF